ncbi:MAG: carbohydrate kinase family protein [Pseudorhodobacter sp.]
MILCCGESLIDMLPRVTTEGQQAFVPYGGGTIFNAVIALGRLGVPAGFYSGISTDMFGEILTRALTESRVDFSLATRSDRPTTLAFVKLVDGQASYAFYDENTAGRMILPEDIPVTPNNIEAFFFGGICLVNDPGASSFAAFQARVSQNHVTMLDPNIRPGLVRDETDYRARIDAMIARADIVKLSDADLHWMRGPGDMVTLARGLVAEGPSLVFVTEGNTGSRAVTRSKDRFVPARKIPVADTVGAGDTFSAAVLASLRKAGALTKSALTDPSDSLLDEALAFGNRAAAVTVSRPGADPPWDHEL